MLPRASEQRARHPRQRREICVVWARGHAHGLPADTRRVRQKSAPTIQIQPAVRAAVLTTIARTRRSGVVVGMGQNDGSVCAGVCTSPAGAQLLQTGEDCAV